MTATHLIHVEGKKVGREHGLQPIPVECPEDRMGRIDLITRTIEDTVRRCLPLAGEPRVQWERPMRASVWVDTDLGRLEVAVCYIEDVTPWETSRW